MFTVYIDSSINEHKDTNHVDKTSSYWNAFRFRSNNVCNE